MLLSATYIGHILKFVNTLKAFYSTCQLDFSHLRNYEMKVNMFLPLRKYEKYNMYIGSLVIYNISSFKA